MLALLVHWIATEVNLESMTFLVALPRDDDDDVEGD